MEKEGLVMRDRSAYWKKYYKENRVLELSRKKDEYLWFKKNGYCPHCRLLLVNLNMGERGRCVLCEDCRNKQNKPTCPNCKTNKYVVFANYKKKWKGWECEKCFSVVKEVR